jgi:hypothetical protein
MFFIVIGTTIEYTFSNCSNVTEIAQFISSVSAAIVPNGIFIQNIGHNHLVY